MLEILSRLNELVGVCEARVKKAEATQTELAALRANLNSQKEQQEAKEKDIQSQNETLDKRKLIVKSLDEARVILKENTDEKKRLKAQADELEKQKADHAKKMADDKSDIQRQKDKCAAMNAETEKKAKNYRVEVMEEILKNSAAGIKK